MKFSHTLGVLGAFAAFAGVAPSAHTAGDAGRDRPAHRSLCTWTVKGKIKADHQLSDLNATYGDVSPLEGVAVKVSARLKTLAGWGWYRSWGEVETDANGYFEVTQEKSCDGRRRFKVEARFQNDDLEVRHGNATFALTKVKWYVVHEEADGVEGVAHTRAYGDLVFASRGRHDLAHDEARDHADIWKTYTAALDRFARYGAEYRPDGPVIVKYPNNSQLANDGSEGSYTNPVTRIIYIYRSLDGARDDLNTTTLLHEFMHRWMFEKTVGELDLAVNLLASQNTHCFEPDHIAFHEGLAGFGAEQLRKILFDAATARPFNRDALHDGLSCGGRVDHIRDLDKMGEHEFGWLSAFRLLREKELNWYTFAGTPVSTSPTHESTQIVRLSGMIQGCHNPAGFNFKRILSVFLPGKLPPGAIEIDGPPLEVFTGAGGSVTLEHDDAFRKDDMTFDTFFNRAAVILGIDAGDKDHLLTLLDPAATAQPRSLLCGQLTDLIDANQQVKKPRVPAGSRKR